ncbi:MAG: beta strand repeat-containing protein, partial [Isosphaeraceae bacterium]
SASLKNSWHLVTAVFVDGNGTNDQLWIDGVKQTLTQYSGTLGGAPLASTETTIGNYFGQGYAFTGELAGVAYFDGTLTAAQIAALANPPSGSSYNAQVLAADPVAYYRLNESGGTVAYDSSGAFDNAGFGTGVTPGQPGPPATNGATAYGFSGGEIYAVVPQSTGLFGQYVLSIDAANTNAPTITAPTLPAQGATTSAIVNQLTLNFSEDMHDASVNTATNYVLKDGNGNTYHLSNPGYTNGLSASYQITDGPLQPGTYTLTISGLTDRMGNAQNPFTLQFSVAGVTGFTNQGRSSDNSATPTALTLTGDPAGTGLFVAGGRGALINNSDVDYWTFSGTSGNSLVISTQNPNSPGNSELEYVVTEPNGSTTLTSFDTANNGNAESAPVTLPSTGTYTVSVHIYNGYYGEYDFRISSATPPLQLDQEPNNTIATADTLALAASGNSEVANVAGTILTPSDLNYFNLGTIQAGYSVLLSSQITSTSLLDPVVSIYNANDVYLNKTNGRPFDGVGQIDITQTGTYYALMEGGNASGGLLDQYVMNVQIVPTSSLALLPNLEVTNISLPTGSNIESGQPITFSWTVTNEGQAPTNVADWSDRAVLSLDTTYGNSDDIPLGNSNGIFAHSGVLAVGGSYTATETVTLPDGISGSYYIIVQTDTNDDVDENTIGRGDAVTVSSGGPNNNGTFNIALAPYPDLVVQGLTVNGPNAAGDFTVSWNTVNQGDGAVANTWAEQLMVKDVTTGLTVVNAPLSFSGGLAANGGTDAHTEPLTGSYLVDSAGQFQVTVTTNSDQGLYEDNPQGHANAVANDTAATTFYATRDLTVTNLTQSSPASPQSGNQVTVTWTDADTGNLATTGGWNDLVTVVNTNTGVTLDSATIPYTGASIQPGGTSATLSTSFTLPDGSAGVGNIKVTVTVNTNNAEAEYNVAGTAGSNNSSTINFTSTLADYADLVVAASSLAVTPASPQSSGLVTVTWNDKNQGDAAVNAAFSDYVLVQKVGAGNNLTNLTSGYVAGNPSLAAGATSAQQQFQFTLPDGASGVGNFLVTVTTDSGQTVKEYDSNGNLAYSNNTSTTNFSSTLANYADLVVAAGSLAVTPSNPQSGSSMTVTWNDKNQGDAAVNAAFSDYVLIQKVNPGNTLTYITAGFVSGNASLAAGATSAQQQFQFTLPDGAAGTGNIQVTVTTDYNETVKEYDSNGNPAYSNNTATTNVTSTLANYADLVVTSNSLSVTPGSPQSGGSATATWTDTNQGDAAVNAAFSDYVLVQKVN